MTNERTSLFLMANLGAEVSRLLSAREAKDEERTTTALARAGAILGELRELPDMKDRAEELAILEKTLTEQTVTPRYLKSYFTPFALRLMNTR